MKGKILLCLAIATLMLFGVFMIGPVSAQPTTIGVEPASIEDPGLGPGSTFTVEIWVRNHDDLKGVEFKLGYDTTVLTATLIEYGDIFGPTYFPLTSVINDTEGWMHYGIMQSLGEPGVSDGRAAIITFDVDSVGESDLHLYETKIGDSSVPPVPVVHDTLDGYFSNVAVVQYDLTITVVGSGTTDPVPGVYAYDAGMVVSVDAIPDAGWMLDHWELDTVDVGAADPYDVTMNMDHTLTAVFVEIPADVTPPTITINEPVARDYLHSETITLDFNATDPSGVASITATLNGDTVMSGDEIELYTLPLGSYTLTVTAVDTVGNSGTETVTFNVIATVGSLQDLVEMFFESGYFHSAKGMYSSLIHKLYAAEKYINEGQMRATRARAGHIDDAIGVLGAFINHLEAQSGKHVDSYAAEILIADAQYVIDNL